MDWYNLARTPDWKEQATFSTGKLSIKKKALKGIMKVKGY
jgi:hypothetical protein